MQFEEIIKILAEHKIPSPRLEARMILDSGKAARERAEAVEKRINGWPLDKILGRREFYKYGFFTDENVLSPRPDTEILVERAIELLSPSENISKSPSLCKGGLGRVGINPNHSDIAILDLGTGSGCILLSILKEFQNIKGVGIDKSPEALTVAKKNAEALGVTNVEFQCRDWFADKLEGKFDLIVSNPPYIPSKDIETLDREVREHDPLMALDGGTDGLESYRKIAGIAGRLLKPGGHILLEAGIGQAGAVADIFTKNSCRCGEPDKAAEQSASSQFTHIETFKDLAGIDRCLLFRC